MQLILRIVSGKSSGHKVWLRPHQSLQIGRTEWADFVVPDPHLSAIHFRVESDASVCRIHDLNSTNGTFLNELRVYDHVLQDGDLIRAGETRFRVALPSA